MALSDADRLQMLAMALMRHSVVKTSAVAESLIDYKENLAPIDFLSCSYSSGNVYGADAIPIMTSYTAPSGMVTFSSEAGTAYKAWYAFDNSESTYWYPNSNAAWISYEFSSAKTIKAYSITPYSAAYSPLQWTFEGYNGSSWDVLDARNVSAFSVKKVFECENDTAYSKYRLNISLSTAGWARIYNIEMMEAA